MKGFKSILLVLEFTDLNPTCADFLLTFLNIWSSLTFLPRLQNSPSTYRTFYLPELNISGIEGCFTLSYLFYFD